MIMDLGFVKNAMFNWKSRGNIPNGAALLKMSKYLDVSVDYLLCNDKYYVDDEEKALLKEYRKLDDKQRENILRLIRLINDENSR